jgi:stearoyl-CoA desaturase (delta-9 desaturase)
MLVWGFFISTIAVMQATFSINSLTHCFGSRRYKTKDESRNNFWLALLTFGEGWHNNHHHFPGSANQGFYWWEVDITYYILRLLQALGIIWDLRGVPEDIRLSHVKVATDEAASQPVQLTPQRVSLESNMGSAAE